MVRFYQINLIAQFIQPHYQNYCNQTTLKKRQKTGLVHYNNTVWFRSLAEYQNWYLHSKSRAHEPTHFHLFLLTLTFLMDFYKSLQILTRKPVDRSHESPRFHIEIHQESLKIVWNGHKHSHLDVADNHHLNLILIFYYLFPHSSFYITLYNIRFFKINLN